MSYFYQIKKLKTSLENLGIILTNLEKDEKSAVDQITSTNDQVEINRIERQLQGIQEKATKRAEECDQLSVKIEELKQMNWGELATPALKCLHEILLMVEMAVIVKAYHSSLMRTTGLEEKLDRQEIILGLEDIPEKPLGIFVNYVIADQNFSNNDRKQMLRNWLSGEGLEILESISIESYLMIKVQKDRPGKYLVSAVIVKSRNCLKPEYSDYLTPDMILNASPHNKNSLPHVLCDLLVNFREKYGIEIRDLHVHWFLPIELMDLPIEKWSIDQNKPERNSGRWCKTVVVRVYERHFTTAYDEMLNLWQGHWRCLWTHRNCDCVDVLDLMKATDLIDHRTGRMCGCCLWGLGEDPENFWEIFIEEGLPIALWQNLPVVDVEANDDTMKLVASGQIKNLPINLTHQRRRNTPEVEKFSLLWDNPFQSFPGVDLEKRTVFGSKNTRV